MTYTIKITKQTTLKTSAAPASTLAPDQKCSASEGEAYPIAAFTAEGMHLKVTLDKDKQGQQLTIQGRNTWYVFADHCKLTQQQSATESDKQKFDKNKPIIWTDPNCPVSRFFTVREVTNGDFRRIPQDRKVINNILTLAAELDRIRMLWGHGIGVTSWYRPPDINRAVGGVPNSQHINGSAADIYTMEGSEREFEAFLDRNWDKALGYGVASGRGFTHCDLRAGRIRWYY